GLSAPPACDVVRVDGTVRWVAAWPERGGVHVQEHPHPRPWRTTARPVRPVAAVNRLGAVLPADTCRTSRSTLVRDVATGSVGWLDRAGSSRHEALPAGADAMASHTATGEVESALLRCTLGQLGSTHDVAECERTPHIHTL